jgi:hypothetical protein
VNESRETRAGPAYVARRRGMKRLSPYWGSPDSDSASPKWGA